MEVETIQHKGCTIRVMYDEHGENPFTSWDGEGMIIFHPRADYTCNTEVSYEKAKENKYCIPLDAYIHSGIALSISGEGMNCQWDTSTHIAMWIPSKYCDVTTKKQAEKIARQNCLLFNQWCNGEVFGYIVEDSQGNQIDSCWGYYGNEAITEVIQSEVIPFINQHIEESDSFVSQCLN